LKYIPALISESVAGLAIVAYSACTDRPCLCVEDNFKAVWIN
jgi:hypothetical protein